MNQFSRIVVEEDGVTVVEYAVMLALISLVLLTSVALVGDKTNGLWSCIQNCLTASGALR